MLPRTPTNINIKRGSFASPTLLQSPKNAPITPKITSSASSFITKILDVGHSESHQHLLQLKQQMRQLDNIILSKQEQLNKEYKSLLDAQIREKRELQEGYAAMYEVEDDIFIGGAPKRRQSVEEPAQDWFPWGKPGAGAPLKDEEGNVRANIKNWVSPKGAAKNRKRKLPSDIDVPRRSIANHRRKKKGFEAEDDVDLASPIDHSSAEADDDDIHEDPLLVEESDAETIVSACSTPVRDESEIREILRRNHQESIARASRTNLHTSPSRKSTQPRRKSITIQKQASRVSVRRDSHTSAGNVVPLVGGGGLVKHSTHDDTPSFFANLGQPEHSPQRSSFARSKMERYDPDASPNQMEKIRRQQQLQQDLAMQIKLKQERLKREQEEEEARLPSYVRSSVSPVLPAPVVTSSINVASSVTTANPTYDDTPIGSHFVRRRGRRSLSPTRRSTLSTQQKSIDQGSSIDHYPTELGIMEPVQFRALSPSADTFSDMIGGIGNGVRRSSIVAADHSTRDLHSPILSKSPIIPHPSDRRKVLSPEPYHTVNRSSSSRAKRPLQDSFAATMDEDLTNLGKPARKSTAQHASGDAKRNSPLPPPIPRGAAARISKPPRKIPISSQAAERRRRDRLQEDASSPPPVHLPSINANKEPPRHHAKKGSKMRRSHEDVPPKVKGPNAITAHTAGVKRHSVANPLDVPTDVWDSEISDLRQEIVTEHQALKKKIHGLLTGLRSNGIQTPMLLSKDLGEVDSPHNGSNAPPAAAPPQNKRRGSAVRPVRRSSVIVSRGSKRSIASRENSAATSAGVRRVPGRQQSRVTSRQNSRKSSALSRRMPSAGNVKAHNSLRSSSKFVYRTDLQDDSSLLSEQELPTEAEFVMPPGEEF